MAKKDITPHISLIKSLKENLAYLSEILEKDFLEVSTSLARANVFVNKALEKLEEEMKNEDEVENEVEK